MVECLSVDLATRAHSWLEQFEIFFLYYSTAAVNGNSHLMSHLNHQGDSQFLWDNYTLLVYLYLYYWLTAHVHAHVGAV